ncbi:MAG: 4Fe-4S dicluster domain-containing protein [Gammaproteobacteria bacterium]|nr:FAD-dependent oxidoreductase [Gammaproteobacteria bacterium]MXX05548.1 4Fe-4S dicluster domain-containing protein [Gammaproteobacteria bacterium]MXY90006.1 4Fe-4S dicluster domain-containing protein [Gammaproteobacteria bacterium]MYE29222.1 4Fe-4S dicluster domain-containing protein [Gammaproteobacteria bacterium]MYG97041.1 4Fe-4S dicluster domain-containing protein [Gammaproteobacteria bacterium]
MKPTDISNPDYFHKVVDCQWACPAHTPVPEYIRLIAEKRYTDAYMINWESNVFPGILGRTCDRPCEPACRRVRVEEQPVAICRLKRVAADYKSDIQARLPKIPKKKNGRHIALVGAGPASLTVARDLLPLGYEITLFDRDAASGGAMRTQIPRFRLPVEVLEEELNYILDMGINCRFGTEITSMKELLAEDFDAIFVGTGAPLGKTLKLPGHEEAVANIHTGIEWLANVAFEHIDSIGETVIVLGGGNTAMDCCRSSKRLGGKDVKVVVRSGFDEMKASPWEIEDAMNEDIPILNFCVPKRYLLKDGKLCGMEFEKVRREYDENGKRLLIPTGEDPLVLPCDDVLCAIGQDNAFPWIERNLGIEFDRWELPVLNQTTFQSTNEKVFFGGDAALGPDNIITAVAHGHSAALSIHLLCEGQDVNDRPGDLTTLDSQKMGIHQWSYDNDISHDVRYIVPHASKEKTLNDINVEVELGFDEELGFAETQRCLNCDVQTVFTAKTCIECDACVDICPTDCITFTANGAEKDLRQRLLAPAENLEQDLYVSDTLGTGRIMAKNEDLCLHCGLCAERCPTSAWDMQKYLYNTAKAVNA